MSKQKELPHGWRWSCLGEVADYINGRAFKPTEWGESGTPIIRIQNLNSPEAPFNFYDGAVDEKHRVRNGDLLISWSASLDAFIWERDEAALNQHIFNVKENRNLVDRKYLYHAVRAAMASIRSKIHGATMQHITKPEFEAVPLALPPLDEQRRIAAILDKADALRQKRRQAIAKLDELAQATFLEMFGDPVTNPMGWPKCTIGDLITEASYGSSGKAGADGEFPMLRMNNITYTGGWNFSDLKYIDYSPKEAAKYLLKKGDLLFNRTNSKELVGKTAVYRRDDVMSFAGYLIRVRANEKANTEFISAFLNSKSGKNLLLNMCKSIVGMANINAQELRSIPITQPPRKLQDNFAKIIAHLETEREKHTQASNMSDKFFTSLQSRAFSGDL